MSFHEVRFPEDISFGATGGPGFNTTVLTLASGFERRNINWSKARAQYDVSQGVKTPAQMATLTKFFYARRGKAYGFRFKDWMDYQLPFPGDATPLLLTTNGSADTIQLVKVYSSGGDTYTRTLTKIVSGSVTVFDNGFTTADYSINLNTGVITLGSTTKSTTGHLITISCEFDVPVRFDIDEMRVSMQTFGVDDWSNIPLVEVRV